MQKIAWIHGCGQIEFGGVTMFMVLRAAHHLAELRCDAPEPPGWSTPALTIDTADLPEGPTPFFELAASPQ